MYITNCEAAPQEHGILRYMPREIRRYMYNIDLAGVQEIRMRIDKPLMIKYPEGYLYLGRRSNLTALPGSALKVTRTMLDEAVEKAAASSVYSVKDEIKNGFITVRGGHRIGITGTAVINGNRVEFIKDVSGLCYRLAREVIGASDRVIDKIAAQSGIKNTLIISPPGAGKTTMLRDIARQLSYKGYSVSIVDERRELAALYEGRSAFDLGFNTDVLEGVDKAEGMLMVLRAMSPDVIITDELGTSGDIAAIEKITNSGTAVIASIHGNGMDMLSRRKDLEAMLGFFDVVITLSRRNGVGTVEELLVK